MLGYLDMKRVKGFRTRDCNPYNGRSETNMGMKKNLCGAGARQYDMGIDKTIYFIAKGEAARMGALVKYGPFVNSITCPRSFQTQYRGGVFGGQFCRQGGGGHAMTTMGYGTLNGQKYWLIANSWGANWGEKVQSLICIFLYISMRTLYL